MWDVGEYKVVFSAYSESHAAGKSVCIGENMSIITGWTDGISGEGPGRIYEVLRPEDEAADMDDTERAQGRNQHGVRGHKLHPVRWGRWAAACMGSADSSAPYSACRYELRLIKVAHTKPITKVMPDLNQPHIIHSCGLDKAICTFDLKKEKKIVGHSIKNGVINDMSQRKDHELELVTGGQGSPICFWDCDEADPVAYIDYPYKVSSLQVSNSGKYLAFGSETNEVFVYNIADPTKFTIVGKGGAHSGPVMKLKWSPDDKQIVSVSADASLCIWNFYG